MSKNSKVLWENIRRYVEGLDVDRVVIEIEFEKVRSKREAKKHE